jgi:hypothetical protein
MAVAVDRKLGMSRQLPANFEEAVQDRHRKALAFGEPLGDQCVIGGVRIRRCRHDHGGQRTHREGDPEERGQIKRRVAIGAGHGAEVYRRPAVALPVLSLLRATVWPA